MKYGTRPDDRTLEKKKKTLYDFAYYLLARDINRDEVLYRAMPPQRSVVVLKRRGLAHGLGRELRMYIYMTFIHRKNKFAESEQNVPNS